MNLTVKEIAVEADVTLQRVYQVIDQYDIKPVAQDQANKGGQGSLVYDKNDFYMLFNARQQEVTKPQGLVTFQPTGEESITTRQLMTIAGHAAGQYTAILYEKDRKIKALETSILDLTERLANAREHIDKLKKMLEYETEERKRRLSVDG